MAKTGEPEGRNTILPSVEDGDQETAFSEGKWPLVLGKKLKKLQGPFLATLPSLGPTVGLPLSCAAVGMGCKL